MALLEAHAEKVVGDVFNIGAATERSILQNAYLVLELLGKPRDLVRFVPDRLGHVRRHAVDSTKLRQHIGWESQTEFEAGMAETVEWYRTHALWLETVLARKDAFLGSALALAESHSGKRG